MPQFRKKPVLTEATQWFANGDHPEDQSEVIEFPITNTLSEGKVVGFFFTQHIPGNRVCAECGNVMQKHGLLINKDEPVCPGDYIVTDNKKGKYYRLKAEEFEAMYELYESPKES